MVWYVCGSAGGTRVILVTVRRQLWCATALENLSMPSASMKRDDGPPEEPLVLEITQGGRLGGPGPP